MNGADYTMDAHDALAVAGAIIDAARVMHRRSDIMPVVSVERHPVEADLGAALEHVSAVLAAAAGPSPIEPIHAEPMGHIRGAPYTVLHVGALSMPMPAGALPHVVHVLTMQLRAGQVVA